MNKVTKKLLSGSAITLALLGGSAAFAMPATAATSASVSQTASPNNDGHGNHNGDNRNNDRRHDRRIEAACNYLDRFFDNNSRDHHSNDRWSNERWSAIERWYERHCEEAH